MSEDPKAPKLTLVGDSGASSMRLLQDIGRRNGVKAEPRIADKIHRAPDLGGEHGCAWKADHAAFAARVKAEGGDPSIDTTLASWVVEAPYAHPIWHSYMLALIHLRPMPGGQEPVINLPGATHQFFLFALDPNEPRDPYIRGVGDPAVLHPMNFSAQFVAKSEVSDADADVEAIQRMEATILDVIDGKLSPDTDFLSAWVARFGDNMLRKVPKLGEAVVVKLHPEGPQTTH